MSNEMFMTALQLGRALSIICRKENYDHSLDELISAILGGCNLKEFREESERKGKENWMEKVKKKHKEEVLSKLKEKWGRLVGYSKPAHAWSWFLETDDSQVMKWSFDKAFSCEKYEGSDGELWKDVVNFCKIE